jgi:hypothetical protein
MQLGNSGETFIINNKIIRKSSTKIGRNKSIGPDGVPDEFLKLGGEAMIPLIYDMMCLTAIGLPPGGSSTVHIYTQTIHRTTKTTNNSVLLIPI